MDDDDPDALEAFIIYLQTSSTAPIENWKIEYLDDKKDSEASSSDFSSSDDFDSSLEKPDNSYARLPEGYIPFLVDVYGLADKYDAPLLAEAVSTLVPSTHVPGNWNRWSEFDDYYENHPIDALKALALLRDMPDSATKNKMANGLIQVIHNKQLAMPDARHGKEDKAGQLEKQIHEVFAAHPGIATDLLAAAAAENKKLREKPKHRTLIRARP